MKGATETWDEWHNRKPKKPNYVDSMAYVWSWAFLWVVFAFVVVMAGIINIFRSIYHKCRLYNLKYLIAAPMYLVVYYSREERQKRQEVEKKRKEEALKGLFNEKFNHKQWSQEWNEKFSQLSLCRQHFLQPHLWRWPMIH